MGGTNDQISVSAVSVIAQQIGYLALSYFEWDDTCIIPFVGFINMRLHKQFMLVYGYSRVALSVQLAISNYKKKN